MKKITFLIFIFLSSYSFAQDSCANGVVLTPGVQQCGNTSEGADVYDNNSCLGSYDGGDDYIFTYTANEDNETLTLTLSGVAGWTGFAMSDFCPDTTGNCLGSETTTSSGTIEFTSDPLSAGVEYYIHISTYPSPQSTDFCLDSVIISPPSCPSPTNLLVNEVSYTTASLSWTAGASEGLWNLEIVDVTAGGSVTGTATETGISNPSTSVSGLSANNDYEFYVQADCGDGTSEWVGPVSFYTGYCQSEPSSNDGSGISNVQLVSTDFTGTDVTYLDFTGTPVDIQQAVTENLQITFVTGYTYDTNVWIDFNDDLVFEASEQVFDGVSTSSNPTTLDASFLVPVNAPLGNHRMRIGTADSGQATPDPCYDGTYGVTVDLDINVIAAPSCLEPSALTSTNISSATANLGWTENGTASVWNVEIVDVTAGGTATGTATDTGVSNPFSVSGLTPNNDYEFYVQADCGGGDTSAWVGPFTFTTACNPITSYPWSEDFESVSTPDLPSCWSHINNNGDTDNWRTYTTYGVGGSTTAGLYTDFNSGNNDDYLVLPQFTLTGNERLKFSVRARSSSEPNDYRVVLSTSGSTPTDFTEELLPLTQVSSTTQTEIAPIDLSSYTGDVYIAIHVPSGGLDGYYIYFDEFVVEPIPSCVEPSDLTATNIMATSADLGWTENGTASTYNVEVVLAGDAATGTATDTAVANGFTKSGLTDNTDYEFYVQAICGGDTSVWSGPYAFTTLCAAIVPNYIADFSTIAPSCWTEGNNTDVATGPDGNNGSWTNDDFLNTVGIEAAKINLYSNTQQDWLVSPVFDFSSGGYGLAFDVGVTAWNSTVAETPNLMGSDDEVLLLISEDNGVTWTTLEAFNVENAPSHTGDNKIYDLSTITSSTVKFAFWATEGSVDDAEDIDFFVANFNVDSYATLGVSEVEDKATFTYYPNPVNNNLTLSAQKEINNVSVYNMVGQEVFRNVPNAMTEVVDMSSLQAGAYFVKVTIGNATKTIKVIKN